MCSNMVFIECNMIRVIFIIIVSDVAACESVEETSLDTFHHKFDLIRQINNFTLTLAYNEEGIILFYSFWFNVLINKNLISLLKL